MQSEEIIIVIATMAIINIVTTTIDKAITAIATRRRRFSGKLPAPWRACSITPAVALPSSSSIKIAD